VSVPSFVLSGGGGGECRPSCSVNEHPGGVAVKAERKRCSAKLNLILSVRSVIVSCADQL